MIAHLAQRLVDAWENQGDRIIVGVCGAPGAGKSSLAASLAARLGADRGVVVPFDGFHLATTVLEGTPLLQRRGALETFDLGAFHSLMSRLRARDEDIVYAPSFVRGLEEPIASAIPVPHSVPIIITEGNYLLSPHPTLQEVRTLLDEVWYLDTPPEVRLPQLIARHVSFGKPPEQAQEWAAGTDQRNAEHVESTRDSADLVITVTR
jgi:pantothenate kinase